MTKCAKNYFIVGIVIIFCAWQYNALGSANLNVLERNLTRFRRQATECGLYTFQCSSGQCISDELLCDGKVNCDDGSDESSNTCTNVPCLDYLFRCNYGGCVSKDSVCNGIQDCRDNSDENMPTCRRTPNTTNLSNCGTSEFACNSGGCIDDIGVCDGKADCSDQSDEDCLGFNCPGFTFRCDYGACISDIGRCDGIIDCLDGSDETTQLCGSGHTTKRPGTPITVATPTTEETPTPATPAPPGSCILPPYPINGRYSVGPAAPDAFKPNERVSPFTVINILCNKRHRPYPMVSYLLCVGNGNWNLQMPRCIRTCPEINISKSTKVICSYRGTAVPCEQPIEDTIANLSCEPLYEEPGISRNPTRRCRDGSWDSSIPQCVPVCGQKPGKANLNVINGTSAKKGEFPWQIGIYRADSKQHICGGSLLNQRVILSAAHCFANNDGVPYGKENYLVAGGKYYREYDDSNDDDYAQYSTISELYIPEQYKGAIKNYESDISLIVLEETFILSTHVQPVCVDWYNYFELEQLRPGVYGSVTGWGYTQAGEHPSDELKVLDVPFIPYGQCYQDVPPDFKPYLTFDKLCAGFLNKGTSVCSGDSGGGLVFPKDGKYYIRGIVSASPASNGACSADEYGAYTKVSAHINLIRDFEILNRP